MNSISLDENECQMLKQRLSQSVHGYSYRELGKITNTHPETARRYMQGKSPSIQFLSAICLKMGISGDWLLTGEGPMFRSETIPAALRDSSIDELLKAFAVAFEKQTTETESLRCMIKEEQAKYPREYKENQDSNARPKARPLAISTQSRAS